VTKSAIQIQTAASLLKAFAAAPSHSPFTAIPPPIIQTDHNPCLQPIPNPQSKITKSPQAKPHGNTTIFFTLITSKSVHPANHSQSSQHHRDHLNCASAVKFESVLNLLQSHLQ
jgi:hypothetical protein